MAESTVSVEFEICNDRLTKKFASISSAVEWLTKETDRWSSLLSANLHEIAAEAKPTLQDHIDYIRSEIQNIKKDDNGLYKETIKNKKYLLSIIDNLHQRYYIFSESNVGLLILTTARDNIQFASGALLGALNLPLSTNKSNDFVTVRVVSWGYATATSMLTVTNGFESASKHQLARLAREFEQFKEEAESEARTVLSNAENQFSAAEERFGAQLTEHEDKLSAIRNEYDREMQLRGPIGYWRDMRRHHDNKYIDKNTKFIFYGFSLVVMIFIIVSVSRDLSIVDFDKFNSAAIAVLGVPVFFGIMVLRQIYRSMQAHEFLANDARERIAMIQTFKALERGKLVDEGERRLVLEALFRPAAVPNDDTSSTPVESLFKAISQPSRPGT